MSDTCPCGSGDSWDDCCGSIISGRAVAETAEALMRSRYSAFARGYPRYLLDSLHPDQRGEESLAALEASCAASHWRSLRILSTEAGDAQDQRGVVEFAAFYDADHGVGQLHERSRFRREGRHWYYFDGDLLPPHKTGRNDPCWCGSGRKLKKCHPS